MTPLPPSFDPPASLPTAENRRHPGRAELLAKDVTPLGDTPEAFKASIAADIAAWRKLADRLGIKPE